MGASISLVEMRGGGNVEYESGFMEALLVLTVYVIHAKNLCYLLKSEICGDCGGDIVYTENRQK